MVDGADPALLRPVGEQAPPLPRPCCTPSTQDKQVWEPAGCPSLPGKGSEAPYSLRQPQSWPLKDLKGPGSLPGKHHVFFQILLQWHLSAKSSCCSPQPLWAATQRTGPVACVALGLLYRSTAPPTALRLGAHRGCQTDPCTQLPTTSELGKGSCPKSQSNMVNDD